MVRNPLQIFQKGIMLSIQSVKALFCDLQTKTDISYILTHRLNQDCLENFFSQVRGKTRFKEHPNPVECLYNIRAIILGKHTAVTKQFHVNTIDHLADEYITSSFCKQSSSILSANNDSVENVENELVDECSEQIKEYEHFEDATTMSNDDGIGTTKK